MISPDIISKALTAIGSSPANREYFFANLHSPEWLVPLRSAGRFKTPIQALRDHRGIAFVPWPESAYLARMAAAEPELVRDIILETKETDNERVHQDFVEAALQMKANEAADIAKFETGWIRKQAFLHTLYPEKVGDLISYLAPHGKTQAAVDLARELLLIVAPEAPDDEEEEEGSFRFPPEPHGKIRQWEYEQVLSHNIPDLARAAPEITLRMLSDLLESALRIHSKDQHDQTEDYSWIWRPDVEFKHRDSYMEELLAAVRDAALVMSTSAETTSKAAELLWSRRWRIFRRIATHVVRASPASPLGLIEKTLTNPAEYEDFPGHGREFDKLLQENFSRISERARLTILSYLERGPDLMGVRERRKAEGQPATEDEVTEIADLWRLKWLHRIHTVAPLEWQNRYAKLAKQFGEASIAESTSETHSWVGPTSPKSADELHEMSETELVGFLRTWQSPEAWNVPTPEGLGRALSSMLATDPQKLAKSATLLRGLGPTYVRSAIEGFTNAIKNQQRLEWDQLMALSEWIIAQGNEVAQAKSHLMDSDPDWNWTRKSVAWFFREALKIKGNRKLAISFRERVFAILTALADDPVPGEERKYTKGMFIGSISLNTTRGVALDAMFDYARWLHSQMGLAESEGLTFERVPELKRELEKHIVHDKSVAAREVFGREYPTLFWIDRKWAKDMSHAVFGQPEGSLGDIAWANHVLFQPPYSELLPVLLQYYKDAVSKIGTGFRKDLEDVDRHLAEHIMVFYWRGAITIESKDGLVRDFFDTAPAKLRAYAIEFIGRNLRGAPPIERGVLNRLKLFWEWRFAELRKRKCDGEAVPYGIWFASGQFDLSWSFEYLLAVLRLCHKVELDFWVVERLAEVAPKEPAAAVQALGMMIEGDQEGWAMHGWRDHPRTILQVALKSNDMSARKEAERVIHLLGSRGWYGYRDLLRPSHQEKTNNSTK